MSGLEENTTRELLVCRGIGVICETQTLPLTLHAGSVTLDPYIHFSTLQMRQKTI